METDKSLWKKNIVWIISLIMMVILTGCMDYTGFAVLETFQDINLDLSEDSSYEITLESLQELSSISVNGEFEGDGTAFIYLDRGDKVYTIFNSELLKDVEEIEYDEIVGESSSNEKELKINVGYVSDWMVDKSEEIDLSIDGSYNWELDENKLCTKIQIDNLNSVEKVCQGSNECCEGIIKINDDWNDNFKLNYGDYESQDRNLISFELNYVDNGTIENSHTVRKQALFKKNSFTFEDTCVDTCSINEQGETFEIKFIINDANLKIERFNLEMEEVEHLDDVDGDEGVELINLTNYLNESNNESETKLNESTIDLENNSESGSNNGSSNHSQGDSSGPSSIPEEVEEYNSSIGIINEDNTSTFVDGELETNNSFQNDTDDLLAHEEEVHPPNVEPLPLLSLDNKTENSTSLNVSSIIGGNISKEKTTYYRVMINSPVRWKKRIELNEEVENLKVLIPENAEEIIVIKIEKGEEMRIENNKLSIEESVVVSLKEEVVELLESEELNDIDTESLITGNVVREIQSNSFVEFIKRFFGGSITGYVVGEMDNSVISTDNLIEKDIVLENEVALVIEELVEEIEIEYYLPGPIAVEKVIDENKKELTISSDIHYENVLTFTDIKEVPLGAINLYWVKEGGRIKHVFEGYDTDDNGLIDYIEWVTPHLSNQTFEIELEILTIQSYPQVGGFWTTEFNTIGQADLEITGWDGTYFEEDLIHVALKCNGVELDADYDGESVYYADYECDGLGEHIVQVLTEGKHTQKFDFGGVLGYANNFASIVPNTINLQGKLENSTGQVVTGTHNFTFKLYDAATGGSEKWTEDQTDVSVDDDGIYDVILGSVSPINLDFDEQYYLGINVDNDGEMTPRINLTSTPYAQRAKFADTVECSDCIDSTEILNFSILPADINYTGSIADGDLLTYNDTLEVFEWKAFSELMNSEPDIIGDNAMNYSEITLNDFTNDAGFVTSSGTLSYYYNQTTTTYTGSLSAGGYTGYKAGNYICDQLFTGTHLCYQSEVMLTIGNNNISDMSQWAGNTWVMTGGAKYSPADLPVNDCDGFTHGSAGDYLGSFWMFDQTDGGSGGIGHCGNSLSLACCKIGGIE